MRGVLAKLALVLLGLPAAQAGMGATFFANLDAKGGVGGLVYEQPAAGDVEWMGACNGTVASAPTWLLQPEARPFPSVAIGSASFKPTSWLSRDLRLDNASLTWVLDVPAARAGIPFNVSTELRGGTNLKPSEPDAGALVAHGTVDVLPVAGLNDVRVPLQLVPPAAILNASFYLKVWLPNPGECLLPDGLRIQAASLTGHRSGLAMHALEGVSVALVPLPDPDQGFLVSQGGLRTPFGSAGLDLTNLTLTLTGPSGTRRLPPVLVPPSHVRSRAISNLEVVWGWGYRDEHAPDGTYALQVTIADRHHEAPVTAHATFVLRDGQAYGMDDQGHTWTGSMSTQARDAPNLTPATLVLGALAQTVARRRRLAPPFATL